MRPRGDVFGVGVKLMDDIGIAVRGIKRNTTGTSFGAMRQHGVNSGTIISVLIAVVMLE